MVTDFIPCAQLLAFACVVLGMRPAIKFGHGNALILLTARRVLQAAVDLGNDPKTALYHVKNFPIRSFEYKTALEMIEAGRSDDVVGYLESLSAGYVG